MFRCPKLLRSMRRWLLQKVSDLGVCDVVARLRRASTSGSHCGVFAFAIFASASRKRRLKTHLQAQPFRYSPCWTPRPAGYARRNSAEAFAYERLCCLRWQRTRDRRLRSALKERCWGQSSLSRRAAGAISFVARSLLPAHRDQATNHPSQTCMDYFSAGTLR